jgi:hypothetical protein
MFKNAGEGLYDVLKTPVELSAAGLGQVDRLQLGEDTDPPFLPVSVATEVNRLESILELVQDL